MVLAVRLADDAAFPSSSKAPSGATVTCGYIGGDAEHVWTSADWREWGTRYRVPIWVRSDPAAANGASDGNRCVAALEAIGAPKPYRVLPYGSVSSLFSNPVIDGYWVADPTGTAHLYDHAGVVATQFGFDGTFDISDVLTTVPLWDTIGNKGPTSVMLDLESSANAAYVRAFSSVLHSQSAPTTGESEMIQVDAYAGITTPVSWTTGKVNDIGILPTEDGEIMVTFYPLGGEQTHSVKQGVKLVVSPGDVAATYGCLIDPSTGVAASVDFVVQP